jgi:hypothetical protein
LNELGSACGSRKLRTAEKGSKLAGSSDPFLRLDATFDQTGLCLRGSRISCNGCWGRFFPSASPHTIRNPFSRSVAKMSELPEKLNPSSSSDEVNERDVSDMYHEVVRDAKEDLMTAGNDVGDMYRMGKQQQFKVGEQLQRLKRWAYSFWTSASSGSPP